MGHIGFLDREEVGRDKSQLYNSNTYKYKVFAKNRLRSTPYGKLLIRELNQVKFDYAKTSAGLNSIKC
jgi:hypothetical protein